MVEGPASLQFEEGEDALSSTKVEAGEPVLSDCRLVLQNIVAVALEMPYIPLMEDY